jgi:hypothetical protein
MYLPLFIGNISQNIPNPSPPFWWTPPPHNTRFSCHSRSSLGRHSFLLHTSVCFVYTTWLSSFRHLTGLTSSDGFELGFFGTFWRHGTFIQRISTIVILGQCLQLSQISWTRFFFSIPLWNGQTFRFITHFLLSILTFTGTSVSIKSSQLSHAYFEVCWKAWNSVFDLTVNNGLLLTLHLLKEWDYSHDYWTKN